MIYTVTLNPALDYITDVENYKEGHTNRSRRDKLCVGGKGINVSIMLSKLQMPSTALGFAAGFTGEELLRRMREEGLQADFTMVSRGMTRLNVKIRSYGQGNAGTKEPLQLLAETEINGTGPAVNEEELETLYRKLGNANRGDVFVFSGSVPKSLPVTVYRDALRYVSDKDCLTIVDTCGPYLEEAVRAHPFLIKPNLAELEQLAGTRLESTAEIQQCCHRLQEMGAANILVSLAGDGGAFLTEDGHFFQAGPPAGNVLNSVGAGDSMVAGFLYGYLKTHSLKNAFSYGISAGSASAFSEGFADAGQVEHLQTLVTVQESFMP